MERLARDQLADDAALLLDTLRPGGHIPFTPRSKKVLELSLREALALKHKYIGTEHILLGLVREGEGLAMLVLTRLGAGPQVIRARVLDALRSTG